MKARTYPKVGSGNLWKMNGRWMYRIGKAEGGAGYLGGLGAFTSKKKARAALDKLIRAKKLKVSTNRGGAARKAAAKEKQRKEWRETEAASRTKEKNGHVNGSRDASGKTKPVVWGKPRVYQLRGPGSNFMWSYRPAHSDATWKGSTHTTVRTRALKILEAAVHQLNTTGTTEHGKPINRHKGSTAVVKHETNGEIKPKRRAIPNAGMGFGEILGVTLEALQQRHNAEADFLKQMKAAAKQFGK